MLPESSLGGLMWLGHSPGLWWWGGGTEPCLGTIPGAHLAATVRSQMGCPRTGALCGCGRDAQRSWTSRNVSLTCCHWAVHRCLPGQDLAGSQVAKEPEKYGLQSLSLSVIEQRLTAFVASLPSCVGLYQFYSLTSMKQT